MIRIKMLKNKKLNQKEICDKWLLNKTINPETLRKIKENGPVYKKLLKKCSLNQKEKTKKDICKPFNANKTINPETLRKIKKNGDVYKKLEKICSLNQKSDIKQKAATKIQDAFKKLKAKNKDKQALIRRLSIEKLRRLDAVESYKARLKLEQDALKRYTDSPRRFALMEIQIQKTIKQIQMYMKQANFITEKLEKIQFGILTDKLENQKEVKANSEEKKIEAIKKIHKLFIPYVKRISINIIDRVNYYIMMKKYMLSIKETKNCVRLYNINEQTKKPIYRVGNRIILDKQIGSNSVFGIVFLSHFKTNIKYGTKFDRLNKFAVKITNQTKENKNEVKVLEDLTKQVIDFKCPHFPISYGHLRCNNSPAKSDNLDDYSIVKDKHKKKKLFPELVNKNKSLLIQINELAAGDLDNYLNSNKNKNISNTIVQLILSILFFNDFTKSYHTDLHAGNFLYHIVKPGGYFHYNIYGEDYYLENQGYLWVIWDFGLIKPFTENNKYGPTTYDYSINFDYYYIIDTIEYYDDILTSDDSNLRQQLANIINRYNKIKDYKLLRNINKELLSHLINNVPSFTSIKPSNIINKKPYTIGSKSPIKPSYFSSIVNYVKKGFSNKNRLYK
jgi:hypothetical protein